MAKQGTVNQPCRKGAKNSNAKLTEADAYDIKFKWRGTPREEVAEMYGVSSVTVRSIQKGHTWAHLKREEDES